MAMLAIGAGIAAAGSIAGGAIAAGGASAAGAAAGAAGQKAYQNALNQRKSNESLAAPYTAGGWAGQNALLQALGLGHLTPMDERVGEDTYGFTRLDNSNTAADRTNALNNFQTSPGYQFRVDQGVKALDRSAAAKGGLFSGAQGKAITDYGQNQGSQEWSNYISQLFGLTGQGASVTNATNSADTTAMDVGNSLGFQGAMGQASSYSNAANALASGISKGANTIGSAVSSYGMSTPSMSKV